MAAAPWFLRMLCATLGRRRRKGMDAPARALPPTRGRSRRRRNRGFLDTVIQATVAALRATSFTISRLGVLWLQ
eukprot:6956560-Alexandrium_andersonii.AAC.1